jgi:prepilin-type N-terminal cleavage/methylation domain-containing protein
MHQAMGRHGDVAARFRRRSQYVLSPIRTGFTITELLVALSVFALLAALLLPAVQQAREASRRTQCNSNLRQIGIAIGAYESAYGVLPSGANPMSLHIALLPYTEQQALHEEYETAQAHGDCCGGLPAPPLVVCPSDPLSGDTRETSNYAVNFGTGVQRYGFNGMFQFLGGWDHWPGGSIRYHDVLDGTSQTAALSEILPGEGLDEDEGDACYGRSPRLWVEPLSWSNLPPAVQSRHCPMTPIRLRAGGGPAIPATRSTTMS